MLGGSNVSHAQAMFVSDGPSPREPGQDPTSVNSMMVGSVATREWGVPGVICSEFLTVNGEAKASGQDLNYGNAGRLVLGKLLAGIEAKDSHVHPVATVHNLRDHGTRLNGHFARGIDDQDVGHIDIFVRLGSSCAPSRRYGTPALSRIATDKTGM
jgi:hypothetical protein